MQKQIEKSVKENLKAIESLLSEDTLKSIEAAAKTIISSLKNRGKIIIFGNGGSASDSQHMAAELVGRFKKERKALPAIALSANTSTITAISNDYGYDISFKRQIEALGKEEDVAIGISTSGTSKNVVEAFKQANLMKLQTIALTGRGGGATKGLVNNAIVVKSDDTPRIQEAHILIIHILCELTEDALAK